MRHRPRHQKEFLEKAPQDEKETFKEDLHHYVKLTEWPLNDSNPLPSLAEGSAFKKPFVLYLNEKEFNSLDRHIKKLKVSRQEWIKYAIYKLLEEEQNYFFKAKK